MSSKDFSVSVKEVATKIELLAMADTYAILQIIQLEKSTFNWETSSDDLEVLRQKIKDPENITCVLKTMTQGVIGYVIAVPSLREEAELKTEDGDFGGTNEKIYVETLVISKLHRGSFMRFKNLIVHLIDEARLRVSSVGVSYTYPSFVSLCEIFGCDGHANVGKLVWFRLRSLLR